MASRELDFAFVGQEPANPERSAAPICTDQVVAFVAPGDPLLAEAPLTASSLNGRQFVMREQGSAIQQLAKHRLREAGCTPGYINQHGSNEAVKRAVEANIGLGLRSTRTFEAERLAGLLEDLLLIAWSCDRSFWLIRHLDRNLSGAEEAFLTLIQSKSKLTLTTRKSTVGPIAP